MGEILAFLRDDRAASPVIGVILVVAIAVILAAVASFFFLDVGQSPNTTPSAKFEASLDTATGQVTIKHSGGQTLDTKNSLSVVITSPAAGSEYGWLANQSDGQITSGETVTVGSGGTGLTGTTFSDGDEIEIVWTGPDGESSNIIFEETLSD